MTDLDNNLVACFSADQDGSNKTFTGYISQQEAQEKCLGGAKWDEWAQSGVCLLKEDGDEQKVEEST